MPSCLRKPSILCSLGAVLIIGSIYLWLQISQGPEIHSTIPDPDPRLANLGTTPEWNTLTQYNGVLSLDEFETALHDIYLLGPNLHFDINSEGVKVTSTISQDIPRVAFAQGPARSQPPRYWRPACELPPAPEDRPLDGLRIAIDPGHIGGDWARMEERWYQIADTDPVTEGDMTLLTAKLLAPELESLGALVTLVRSTPDPVTNLRPDDLRFYARRLLSGAPEAKILSLSQRLFYRTAEIRARASLVNNTIRPDIVLCLHFNAERWGPIPTMPELSPRNHFHMILHGAYLDSEIAHEDERFELMHKIFQRTHEEEAALAKALATSFLAATGLPAYLYSIGRPAKRLGPALWARNLLANRLYQCPVLFFEPYVMNNKEVYQRIQEGDYEGMREVAGSIRKSIYREYRDAILAGLTTYYGSQRTPH